MAVAIIVTKARPQITQGHWLRVFGWGSIRKTGTELAHKLGGAG